MNYEYIWLVFSRTTTVWFQRMSVGSMYVHPCAFVSQNLILTVSFTPWRQHFVYFSYIMQSTTPLLWDIGSYICICKNIWHDCWRLKLMLVSNMRLLMNKKNVLKSVLWWLFSTFSLSAFWVLNKFVRGGETGFRLWCFQIHSSLSSWMV
jgi:hypothetical protein